SVTTAKRDSISDLCTADIDAGNYTFNTATTTTADITTRALTISATGVNKVYDGATTATVNLSDNRVSGDVFTDSFTTATFADKRSEERSVGKVSGPNSSQS